MTCLLLSLNVISIEVLLLMMIPLLWHVHVQQHVSIIRMAHFPALFYYIHNVQFHFG